MQLPDDALNGWLAQPGDVLVIGFARSGAAAAELLTEHGFHVTVNERAPRPVDTAAVERLEQSGVHFVFGGHPPDLLDHAWQFIVKNPGIPYEMPLIVKAMEHGIPIFTEVEIASWFTTSPIYSITGSNGKTTTTTLLGEILRVDDKAPVVAGNIGNVVSGVVRSLRPEQPVVLELSSFQLMGTWRFHPRIAAVLNFFPAHLDYHGTFEAYQKAKWMMFQNQGQEDVAVLNYDDELIRSHAPALRSRKHWFSVKGADFTDGSALLDDHIVLIQNGERRRLLPVQEVALKGEHNLQNLLAAAAIAQAAGATDESIAHVARSFAGVEHRLEFVREVDGVRYYNDSKATNPDACRQALRAFPENLVWVAGGLDRKITFEALTEDLKDRVKGAVLLGETRDLLEETCKAAGIPEIAKVDSIDAAVLKAKEFAQPGDIVLLSPACASWDMFTSFEVRGSMFKDAVHRL